MVSDQKLRNEDPGTPQERKDIRAEEYLLEAFRSHSNLLRNWFVAYGVGAPALFFGKEDIWKALKSRTDTRCIFAMFVAVLFIQGFYLHSTKLWIIISLPQTFGRYQIMSSLFSTDVPSDALTAG